METTENVSPTVPINEKQETQPTTEIQPAPEAQPAPEVQPVETQPDSEAKPVEAVEAQPVEAKDEEQKDGEESDESESNLGANVVLPGKKTAVIDGPTFVSQMFSENPGEISKFLKMAPKELKKEQDKMKRKGFTMDNKYANLFLLQTVRDECGILVFGCLAAWLLTRLHFSIYWTLLVIGASLLAYVNFNNRQKHLYYNKERKAYNQRVNIYWTLLFMIFFNNDMYYSYILYLEFFLILLII